MCARDKDGICQRGYLGIIEEAARDISVSCISRLYGISWDQRGNCQGAMTIYWLKKTLKNNVNISILHF